MRKIKYLSCPVRSIYIAIIMLTLLVGCGKNNDTVTGLPITLSDNHKVEINNEPDVQMIQSMFTEEFKEFVLDDDRTFTIWKVINKDEEDLYSYVISIAFMENYLYEFTNLDGRDILELIFGENADKFDILSVDDENMIINLTMMR